MCLYFLCNSVIYSSCFSLSCSSQATKTKYYLDWSDMLSLFSDPVSLYMCNNSRNGANLSGSFIFTLLRFLHSPYYTTISPEYFQKFYKQKDGHKQDHTWQKHSLHCQSDPDSDIHQRWIPGCVLYISCHKGWWHDLCCEIQA